MGACRHCGRCSALFALATAAPCSGPRRLVLWSPHRRFATGFLPLPTIRHRQSWLPGFWEWFAELGWVQGRNPIIEER